MRPRRSARLSAVVGLICLVTVTAAAPAQAAAATPKVAVIAVGQEKAYFELTLAPGASRRLAVEVSNSGTVRVSARTYPAEAYSLVNGGFGAKLRDEASGGTTTWLDYRPETLQLEPGAQVTRDFTVSAPRGAAPGEYITSVVVEHDLPAQGKGIVLKQVTRHVVAVAITVPGPLVAGLATGAGRQTVVAGRSVVGIQVRNTGNTHLRPKGELVVTDAAGAVVHRGAVNMDTVYAHTTSSVEQPLDRLLPPGTYMISATLADKGVSVAAAPVPFEVAKAAPVVSPEAPGALPAIGRAVEKIRQGEASVWLLAGAAVGLLGTGLVVALVGAALVHRRRRRRDASVTSDRPVGPQRGDALRPAADSGGPVIDLRVRVLVCDDEPDVRLLYREVVEAAGAVVVEAADGDECLEIAEAFQPDLVFLDVVMPGRGGLDVLTDLRRCHPRAHVVVISGVLSAQQRGRARELGAEDCLEKLGLVARIPGLLERYAPPLNKRNL
jgi:two-component system chemotaxis response regulator CheY